MEQWKPVIVTKKGKVYDYTNLYEVSTEGRVRSLNYNRTGEVKVLKPGKTKDGYLTVCLRKDEKQRQFYIHRLVAEVFIPNPENKPEVNHVDENKQNNVWTNLEWTTHLENVQYSVKDKPKSEEHKRKISESKKGHKPTNARKVRCIETGEVFDTVDKALAWARIKGGIIKCCQGKLKTAGGYTWEYVEEEG